MAATESTTTADPALRAASAPRRSRLKPLLRAAGIFAISAVLVYLAWPRLHAALLFLPVDTAINNYYETGETPTQQLEGLQRRARESIAVHPHHRYHDGLSLLHFLAAADPANPLHRRRQSFERSIEAASESLRRAPAQPRAWLRIAQARAWLRYPPDEVIAGLKMAVYTGRVEPSMFMTRLALGLSYLPRMDGEGRAMMRDQVLLAWQLRRGEFVRSVRAGEVKLRPVGQLLAEAHGEILDEIRSSTDGASR